MEHIISSLANWHLPFPWDRDEAPSNLTGQRFSLKLASQLLQVMVLEEKSRHRVPVGLSLKEGCLTLSKKTQKADLQSDLFRIWSSWSDSDQEPLGTSLLAEVVSERGRLTGDHEPILNRLFQEVAGLPGAAFLGRSEDWWPSIWDSALEGQALPFWARFAFWAHTMESGHRPAEPLAAAHGAKGLSLAGLFEELGLSFDREWIKTQDLEMPEELLKRVSALFPGPSGLWVWADPAKMDAWSSWVLESWQKKDQPGVRVFWVNQENFPSGSVVIGPEKVSPKNAPEGLNFFLSDVIGWCEKWLEKSEPSLDQVVEILSFARSQGFVRNADEMGVIRICLSRAFLIQGQFALAEKALLGLENVLPSWRSWLILVRVRILLKQGRSIQAKDLMSDQGVPSSALKTWKQEWQIAAMDLAIARWDLTSLTKLSKTLRGFPPHLKDRYRGYRLFMAGKASHAKTCFEKALKENPGGAFSRGRLAHGLGHCLDSMQKFAKAQDMYQFALEAFEEAKDPVMQAFALKRKGQCLRSLGDLGAAEICMRRAMTLMFSHGGPETVSMVRFDLAMIMAENGDLSGARPLFEQSLRNHETLGEVRRQWVDHFWLILLKSWLQVWPEVIQDISHVYDQVRSSEHALAPELDCSFKYLKGLAFARTFQKAKLQGLLKELKAHTEEAGDRDTISILLQAELSLQKGKPSDAKKGLAKLDPRNLEPHLFHHMLYLRAKGAGPNPDRTFWRDWARSMEKTGDLWSMTDFLNAGGPKELITREKQVLLAQAGKEVKTSGQKASHSWWDDAAGSLVLTLCSQQSVDPGTVAKALSLPFIGLCWGEEMVAQTGVLTETEDCQSLSPGWTWVVPVGLDKKRRDILARLPLGAGRQDPLKKVPDWALKAGILGQDPAWLECLRRLEKVAQADFPVLILGEPGTGKERLARALHHLSARAGQAFLPVNGASLGGDLADAEIFGFRKGAFTGADRDKPGLVEVAAKGTLFLDEVGELPGTTQAKLLRFVQEGEFFRLGETTVRHAHPRLVSATNQPIDNPQEGAGFRPDLFHRLAGVTLKLPPLRQRRRDIVPLFKTFLRRHSNGKPLGLSPSTLALLASHPWPGNVRELNAAAQRAALFCEGASVQPEHLDLASAVDLTSIKKSRKTMNKMELVSVLEGQNQNITRTAKVLGMSRNTLLSQMDRLGIPRKGRSGRPGQSKNPRISPGARDNIGRWSDGG